MFLFQFHCQRTSLLKVIIRTLFVIVLMILSVIDLSLTAFYVYRYRQWQPEKPFNLIEKNPLLVFLWDKIGFVPGMLIGAIIILLLVYVIASTSWILGFLLLATFIFTMFNHLKNFGLLTELIKLYPLGHLPETIFGSVVGNN